MHIKNVNPNKSYVSLVNELIPKEYSLCTFEIQKEIIKLIPFDLIISFDDQRIFMDEYQVNEYWETKERLESESTDALNNEANKIANTIIKMYENKNNDVYNLYGLFEDLISKKYNPSQNKFIRSRTIKKFEHLGYYLVNLYPLEMTKNS